MVLIFSIVGKVSVFSNEIVRRIDHRPILVHSLHESSARRTRTFSKKTWKVAYAKGTGEFLCREPCSPQKHAPQPRLIYKFNQKKDPNRFGFYN